MYRLMSPADERGGGVSKRLSDKYGIPEEEVKNLLYGKNPPALDPVPAEKGAITNPMERTPNRWNPVSVLGALLGILGILSLIVLIVAMMRHHDMERENAMRMMAEPPMQMMVHPTPPPPAPAPMDSCCMKPDKNAETSKAEPSKEEPSKEESSSSEAPKPKASKRSGSHASHHATKGFTTTSDLEAEEHLADLRAEGNTKAKITSTTTNGITTYTVK